MPEVPVMSMQKGRLKPKKLICLPNEQGHNLTERDEVIIRKTLIRLAECFNHTTLSLCPCLSFPFPGQVGTLSLGSWARLILPDSHKPSFRYANKFNQTAVFPLPGATRSVSKVPLSIFELIYSERGSHSPQLCRQSSLSEAVETFRRHHWS